MSDAEPTPDDLLVSAVLDGIASPEEAARVAADPRLAARLAEFRAVARAVGGPVPLVDPDVRDAHLARAIAAVTPSTTPMAPPPAPPPVAPPPLGDLGAARARRHRPRSTTILSIAAAVVLVVAAGTLVVRLGDSTTGSGDDTAASQADSASTAENPEALAGGGQADGSEDEGGSAEGGESQDFATPTTTAATESAPGTATDSALPSLGTFAKGADLAARVQGELVLDPSPVDRATDEACADDFGVDVALLGRATVAGEEGLVYVEAAPRTDRRLWLVDPGTVGADDACRQIVPVQTI
jgi:hypothetical protein